MAFDPAELRQGVFEAFAEASRAGREWFDGVRFFRVGPQRPERRGEKPRKDCCQVCGARAPSHRCLDAPLVMRMPTGRYG